MMKAVIKGIGGIGRQVIEMGAGKGVEFIAAVDQWDKLIGKPLSELVDYKGRDIIIEDDLNQAILREKPDIVILTNATKISDLEADYLTCIDHQVDVITVSEDSYFWKFTDKERGQAIHDKAQKANVTIFATGIQDAFWNGIPHTLMSVMHDITEVNGITYGIMDAYGPAVIDGFGIGITLEEYEKRHQNSSEISKDAFSVALMALIERLGLTVKSASSKSEPVVSKEDIYHEITGRTIPAGDVVGSNDQTFVETEEGIHFSCQFISRLSDSTIDTEEVRWEIKGTPNMSLVIEDLKGEYTTSAALINRLPDIKDMPSGFVTVADVENSSFFVE